LEKPAFLRKIYKGFFSNPDLDLLAQVSKDFQAKFSEPPSRDQLKILIRNLKEKREMDDDLIDAVFQTDIKQYDEDWLDRTSKAWVSWKYFDKKLISTIEFVKLQDVRPEKK
jgi:hypothetical protein